MGCKSQQSLAPALNPLSFLPYFLQLITQNGQTFMQKETVGPKKFLLITVEWTFDSQSHRMVWKGQWTPCSNPPTVGMDIFQEIRWSSKLHPAWHFHISPQPLLSAQATDLLPPLAVLLLQHLWTNRRITAAQKPTTDKASLLRPL